MEETSFHLQITTLCLHDATCPKYASGSDSTNYKQHHASVNHFSVTWESLSTTEPSEYSIFTNFKDLRASTQQSTCFDQYSLVICYQAITSVLESRSQSRAQSFSGSLSAVTGRKNRYACALKMATVKIQNGGQRIAFLHVTGDQFTTAHLSSRCVFWLNFELNSFTVRQASSDDNRIPFT